MSIAEHVAADAFAAIKAGLLSRGATWKRWAGGGINSGEAPATRACPTSRIGQAQLGTSTIAAGALVHSWGGGNQIQWLCAFVVFLNLIRTLIWPLFWNMHVPPMICFYIVESKRSFHVFLSCDFKLFVLNWVWEPGCTSLQVSHHTAVYSTHTVSSFRAECLITAILHKPEGNVQVETCKWHNSWFVTNLFCFTDKLIVVQSRFFSSIQWNLHDWMLSWQWNQFQAVSGESALWLICTQNSDGLNLFVSEILELWTKSTKNKTNLVTLVVQTSGLIWSVLQNNLTWMILCLPLT